MRTLLVTGPGGSGRTTIAAATAVAEARRGRRVLLLPAHRGGAFSGDLPGVRVIRTDPAASFRADALDVQGRLGSVLDLLGATPLDPEELTELPGAGTLALLRALRDAASEDTWDLVVADLPPVHEALAALALPEQLRRYLGRLVPAERQAARALRPVLAQLAGVPMPGEKLYEAAGRADVELAAAQAVIEDPGTTVRLVVEPGAHAADAIRHARTGLALYGHRLEAVIANRLLPAASPDPWLAELSAQQHKELRALRAELARTPLHEVPHLGREPLNADDLAALALPELPGLVGDRRTKPWTVEDRLASDGHFLWRLPLPGATRERLDLVRRGDELVVDTEGFRRILPLPSALRRCTVAGAALRDGALSVRFEPDPSLWPR
ncbi:ArsA family ATPase [Streptomyces sp. NBC_01262]|uniref:ArsA family ATPase n=1 Tax=Streptomyces sp. NBC_01262 TaxID=2903803 RepID=UPI002E303153|nr:ArsA-related P-loop ATPase [Streptomyces sp. NBC_01262]